ncbi:hypothetical protein SIID45300_01044 [Candidatus Magnetaquicoccaceae bacterium FCR-1]|uniref:DNA-binding protein n=1 Tax=Candidatus Magnetaquiglobus chichijimensis TaxID=3141448 RepID=A0ABQ0C768_9PROT
MPDNPDLKEIKERNFRARGLTVKSWASMNGFPVEAVYRVLNGQLKANFGRAHQIAVALGMKSVAA